jgi:hypothetical protein
VSAADRHQASNEACLDPETLALWVDDGLSAAERAAAERHVADCARCQATLAALVRTAPVLERQRPWWQTLKAAWLAPVAAAATALAIWIAVPGAPPPRSLPESAPASAPAAPSPQPAKEEAQSAPATAAKPPAVEGRDQKALAEKLAPASEVAAAPPPVAETAPAAASPPVAAPAPAATASPAAAARRSFSEVAADALSRPARQANSIASEIIAPDPMSRWRITGGRIIEHSADGGATWQEQPAGATFMLTAGSAPSPLVCWMVGQAGVVLLSTDGLTWRRMGLPTTADLVSVRATDERTATVTDVNGRTYVTTDGGMTWIQR